VKTYKLKITVSDGEGAGEDVSDNFFTIDNTAPYIEIVSPTDGSTCYSASVGVNGAVADNISDISAVFVNGVNTPVTDGSFTAFVSPLREGYNMITVEVQDECGNTATGSVVITHVPSTEVYPEESIQDAIDDSKSLDIIYAHDGTYYGDIYMKSGKALIGESAYGTVIRGHVIFKGNKVKWVIDWEIGYNYRLSNLSASLGLAQLERIEELCDRKKRIHDIYLNHLGAFVKFQQATEGSNPVWWMSSCLFDSRVDVAKLMKQLLASKIPVRRVFQPVVNYAPYEGNPNDFKNAGTVYNHSLCLPSSTLNSDEDIRYVCDTVKGFL